eukprot:2486932-Pyramimonas_sp.AAC.1
MEPTHRRAQVRWARRVRNRGRNSCLDDGLRPAPSLLTPVSRTHEAPHGRHNEAPVLLVAPVDLQD